MRDFNEWRQEETKDENPAVLIEKLDGIAHNLELELKEFKGNRFDGFLELIGSVRALQQNLAAIKHQVPTR